MTTNRRFIMEPTALSPTMHLWLAELRSGNYTQCRSRLFKKFRRNDTLTDTTEQFTKSFCVLGVGVAQMPGATLDLGDDFHEAAILLPGSEGPVRKRKFPTLDFGIWLGLFTPEDLAPHGYTTPGSIMSTNISPRVLSGPYAGNSLVGLNDTERKTFAQIADIIEQGGIEVTIP